MRHNPLIAPILHILNQAEGCISEYDLIHRLEANGSLFDVTGSSYHLSLFRKHFMVMNALYALQAELGAEGIYLQISALNISISRGSEVSAGTHLADHVDVKLGAYYLDWHNYDVTGEEDVQRLLAGFWQRYAAVDKRQIALQVLGLETDVDWEQIREGYRRMAMQHHPDKGGDEKKFIEIREAYEILRCCYERI
jgi:hypothetical protein